MKIIPPNIGSFHRIFSFFSSFYQYISQTWGRFKLHDIFKNDNWLKNISIN